MLQSIMLIFNNSIVRFMLFLCLLSCLPYQPVLAEDTKTIRFGILSIAQPARIFRQWAPFAEYMSRETGANVEIVVPRGFSEMKKRIADGKIDFFYINSHVFYRLKLQNKAFGVAQMKNIEGKTTSQSEIFVKSGSGINSINDLKGKTIAYISPMGAGGYLAPRALLFKNGLESGVETKESFTRNLSNSIHGVLLGDYDAATMCGVNYRLMSRKIETGELKVIAISDNYPENVIGANPSLDKAVLKRFKDVLLDMSDNPEGIALLSQMQGMKIKSFINYDEKSELLTQNLIKTGRL